MSKPPVIFSPRWWRICFMIIGEAQLFSRFLCWVGIHRWDMRMVVKDNIMTDYMRCVRSPFCRYREWLAVNRERTLLDTDRDTSV